MMTRALFAIAPITLFSALACDPAVEPLEDRCVDAEPWQAGEGAFVERTEEAGLTGVEGQRLSAVDLDLDGDADLVIRRTGAAPNDLSKPLNERTAWILENITEPGKAIAFRDVSEASGFFATRNGGAAGRMGDVIAFADVDNDGDLDAYSGVNSADDLDFGETSEILLNRVVETGTLKFELADGGDVRREGQPDLPAAAVFFDMDRDGDVDLFTPEHNYGDNFDFVGNRIYENDGTGRFSDVHEQVGLVSREWVSIADLNQGLAHTRSWSGAACDLNGDGDMELLAGSYGRSPNHLWRASRTAGGKVAYENASVASGYAYDDVRTFTDNQMYGCFCADPTTSDASESCTEAIEPLIVCPEGGAWDPQTDEEPFRLGGNNATVLCADLDGDRDLDLVTTTIKHWWAGSSSDPSEILVNDGTSTFTRPGREATGLVIDHGNRVDWDEGIMSGGTFDFDNDGRVDIYLGASDYPGNRGLLFHNDGALQFSPVDTADFFEHNRSHGIALADFDRDGDVDAIVGHSLSRCDAASPNNCYATANVRLFENTAGSKSNWTQLALVGTGATNRAAIGARVIVTTTDASGATITQTQEVGGGFGHFGAQNDLALTFGLGDACEADVEVRWPDASLTTQKVKVQAGYRFTLTQGADPVPQ
jgi:enediyne biosynthesis protein E4